MPPTRYIRATSSVAIDTESETDGRLLNVFGTFIHITKGESVVGRVKVMERISRNLHYVNSAARLFGLRMGMSSLLFHMTRRNAERTAQNLLTLLGIVL